MAISWYIVRICAISQEIATAFGLAMTVEVGSRCGFARVRRYHMPTVTSLRLGKLRLTDILDRIPNVFYR